mgnify:CR=1 FL=1
MSIRTLNLLDTRIFEVISDFHKTYIFYDSSNSKGSDHGCNCTYIITGKSADYKNDICNSNNEKIKAMEH